MVPWDGAVLLGAGPPTLVAELFKEPTASCLRGNWACGCIVRLNFIRLLAGSLRSRRTPRSVYGLKSVSLDAREHLCASIDLSAMGMSPVVCSTLFATLKFLERYVVQQRPLGSCPACPMLTAHSSLPMTYEHSIAQRIRVISIKYFCKHIITPFHGAISQ